MSVYVNLNSSTLVAGKVFIEDARHDGLIRPARQDAWIRHVQRGHQAPGFRRRLRRSQAEESEEDFSGRLFEECTYGRREIHETLTLLIEEMKKS